LAFFIHPVVRSVDCGAAMPCLVAMSQKELHRLEAVQKVRDRRLSVSNAAKILSICRSHAAARMLARLTALRLCGPFDA